MTCDLKDAVDQCVKKLLLAGHVIDPSVIAEMLKTSGSPKYAKFVRVKGKILTRQIQVVLDANNGDHIVSNNNNDQFMNEQMRKLYSANDRDVPSRPKKKQRLLDDKKGQNYLQKVDPNGSLGLRPKTFMPEVLPQFTLDSVGGADK